MTNLEKVLYKQGRITQAQFDKLQAKEEKRKAAKSKDLQKLTKAELIAIIESIL